MKTQRLWWASSLALALLLAACTFQFNTRVEADGAGVLRTEIGFDFVDQQGLSGLGMSPEEFCETLQTGEGLPVQSPVTVEERGSEVWCVLTFPFQNLTELEEIYAGMGGVTVNELTLSDSGLLYDVDLEFTGSEAGEFEFPDVPVNFRWQVALAGTVAEHNADEADGNTLTWEMALGEAVNARARSEFGREPTLPALPGPGGLGRTELIILGLLGLCCCTGLVGALGAGAFFIWRSRQAPKAPAA